MSFAWQLRALVSCQAWLKKKIIAIHLKDLARLHSSDSRHSGLLLTSALLSPRNMSLSILVLSTHSNFINSYHTRRGLTFPEHSLTLTSLGHDAILEHKTKEDRGRLINSNLFLFFPGLERLGEGSSIRNKMILKRV